MYLQPTLKGCVRMCRRQSSMEFIGISFLKKRKALSPGLTHESDAAQMADSSFLLHP